MNTATRLFIAALLVALLYGLTHLVQAGLKPPDVKLPERDIREMPLQFGPWRGKDVELDPKVFIRIGADIVVDREYQDDQKHTVSVHTAVFSDPDEGVMHSPINCYRANGWGKLEDTRMQLEVAEGASIPVSFSTWEREGERVLVMYWYQLGEYVIFDRFGLGGIRWKMRGKDTWPALIKVLLQASAADPEGARKRMEGIAKHTYQWINQPGRQPTPDSPNE